jgi:hypothetical protein
MMRKIVFLFALLLVPVSIAACTAARIPEIQVEATDFAFTAPESVEEGWTRIRFTNSSQTEVHHLQLVRLNDGVSMQQFQEALQQGEAAALPLVQFFGGAGPINPSSNNEAIVNLPAGQYLFLCFVPSPGDGVPHLAKGMISPLTVTSGDGRQPEQPEAAVVVHLKDFAIDMPDSLPAGNTTVQITNDGPESHEWVLLKLADGKTAADVMQFFTAAEDGPPPFASAGGFQALTASETGYAEVDLTPGTYIALCVVPSPANQGAPHAMLGMVKEFTVTN